MKRLKLRRLALVAMAGLVVPAAACSSVQVGDGASPVPPLVGVSLNSLEYPFIVTMNDSMKAAATTNGVTLNTLDSRAKVATELSQMEDLITRRPKVIVMDAVDAKSSQAAGRLVNQAKIPLVLVDNRFDTGSTIDVASYVGTDAKESGRLEAQALNKALPDGGKIIFLVGVYGAPWTENRKAGFLEVVDKNISIATEIEAHGARADGKTVMEDLLRRYQTPGSIDAVVAQNDEMAVGAISAIREANRQSEFKTIISVDGSEAGLAAVKDGTLTATIRQDPAKIGAAAVETAAKVARGEQVDKEVLIPFETVTKDNVADFS